MRPHEVEILLVEDNPNDAEWMASKCCAGSKVDPHTKAIPGVVLTSSREEPDIAKAYELVLNHPPQ